MEKVKVRLEVWDKTVLMQVLEMDEELRGNGVLFEKNGLKLKSVTNPHIDNFKIYIRGKNKDLDNGVFSLIFDSEQEAQEYYNKVKDLIESFNNEVDWNKVKVDTQIFVRNSEEDDWQQAHFSNYVGDLIYSYVQGRTSWTSIGFIMGWKYAKLAEQES